MFQTCVFQEICHSAHTCLLCPHSVVDTRRIDKHFIFSATYTAIRCIKNEYHSDSKHSYPAKYFIVLPW